MSDGGPKKDWKGKTRLELMGFEAVEDTAKAVEFGAVKYVARNWEQGMPWSVPYAAALRHLFKWWCGEDFDKESGLSHLAHAACNIMFLQTYRLRGLTKDDDRPTSVAALASVVPGLLRGGSETYGCTACGGELRIDGDGTVHKTGQAHSSCCNKPILRRSK